MKKEEKTADEEKGLSELEKKTKKIPIIIVDVDRQPKPNMAIQGVELEAAIPVAGLPVKATVEVFNAATFEDKRLVELYIDDTKEATSSELKIPPQGRATFPFQFTFKRGGLHRGEVRLVGEDGSKYDDRRFFTMEVDQGSWRSSARRNMRFPTLMTRSTWTGSRLGPGRSRLGLRATVLTAKDLLTEPLSTYAVVYCVNIPGWIVTRPSVCGPTSRMAGT